MADSILPPPNNAPPPSPAPAPSPPAPPASETDTPPAVGEKPDYLPDALWSDNGFNAAAWESLQGRPERAADVPEKADGYTLPQLDGFDHEAAASSPLMNSLREAAFKNGMGQAAFDEVITSYVAGETEAFKTYRDGELAKLGENAEGRMQNVSNWLGRSLPENEAQALIGAATSADAIVALEKLMNSRTANPPPGDPPPVKQAKTREEIAALMASKAYRGKASERDPAVIKEVEEWFQAQEAGKQ